MEAETLSSFQGEIIHGPLLITPDVFFDSRGFFLESWNQLVWQELLNSNDQTSVPFVQDNHSRSIRGVLRGLHYQLPPKPQAKLVRCVVGEIFDVAVDLRIESPTKGQWVGAKLNANNQKQLWIPVGFAHGFLTLSDYAEVLYKASDFWARDCERSVFWADDQLAIVWPDCGSKPLTSEKDDSARRFKDLCKEDMFS